MNKKDLEQKCKYAFPSDLDFNLENNRLEVILGSKSINNNMQNDSSAFEGWIICLMAMLNSNDTDRINEVNIRFSQEPNFENCSNKERQFYYRLFKAAQNYGWKIPEYDKIQEIVNALEGAILTTPTTEAKKDAEDIEAKLERVYVEIHSNDNRTIYQQLPLGLFKDVVTEANRLTPTSFLDMWEIDDDNTLRIYELKAKNNKKVGILSELLYYVNIIDDFIQGKFKFRDSKKSYRGIDKLKEYQDKKSYKKIQGVFLADKLHPIIEQNREIILEIMNKKCCNISFSFETYKDNITIYSEFKENERARHEMLLGNSNNVVFPANVIGGGWYYGKERPFCIQKGKEDFNLYKGIRDGVKQYFDKEHIAFWGNQNGVPNHTLSSQVACLNHLFAVRDDKDTVLKIAEEITNRKDLKGMLPVECDKDPQYIAFEVVSQQDHLNEGNALQRGAFCTSIDAVMLADLEEEKKLLIIIEWKYTELYNRNDKSRESDPNKSMQPEAKGIERLNRYCKLITESEYLKSITDISCENELGLDDEILPYRSSIYFQEPYYQLMRQTLWAEQMIKYQSVEKIKATEFMHIHVVPEKNLELLNNGFDGDKSTNAMCESWTKQLIRKDIYKCVDPHVIKDVLLDKYPKLHKYLTERYYK